MQTSGINPNSDLTFLKIYQAPLCRSLIHNRRHENSQRNQPPRDMLFLLVHVTLALFVYSTNSVSMDDTDLNHCPPPITYYKHKQPRFQPPVFATCADDTTCACAASSFPLCCAPSCYPIASCIPFCFINKSLIQFPYSQCHMKGSWNSRRFKHPPTHTYIYSLYIYRLYIQNTTYICMYICLYICIYAYMYICLYIIYTDYFIYMSIYVYICIYMSIYRLYTQTTTYIYIYIYICIYVYICLYIDYIYRLLHIYVYICQYICVYVYIYVYIYRLYILLHIYYYIYTYIYVAVCTKEPHTQVNVGIVMTSGSLYGEMVVHQPPNARDVGSSPALGTIFPIFITPMTLVP